MAGLSEESSNDRAFPSAGEGEIDPALLPLSRLALATTARNNQQVSTQQQQQQHTQHQQPQKAASRDRSPLSATEARERSREPSTGSQPSLHSSAGSDRVRGDSGSLEGAAQQLNLGEDVSSYNLLCEDDPDDFVTLELPADYTTTDSDAPPLELESSRRKGGGGAGGFLDNLRKSRQMSSITTVITGGKRPSRGGGSNSSSGSGSSSNRIKKSPETTSGVAVPLHDMGDEPRVFQAETRSPSSTSSSPSALSRHHHPEVAAVAVAVGSGSGSGSGGGGGYSSNKDRLAVEDRVPERSYSGGSIGSSNSNSSGGTSSVRERGVASVGGSASAVPLLEDSMARRRSNDLVPSDHSPLVPRHNSDLLESHMISHQHNQQFVGGTGIVGVASVERGEEFQGITAGIGLTKSGRQHSAHTTSRTTTTTTTTTTAAAQRNYATSTPAGPASDPYEVGGGDTHLSSEMLLSMNLGVGAPEMSVQPSLHIGLDPANLHLAQFELPSDEEMAKEASRARIDSIGSDTREFADEDVESTTWCEHRKHIFVLSLSGKPVYSRYGKEDKLVNLFGIMQALVSFIQDDRDNLRSIVSGGHKFVFVCRGPLVLVSVAQTTQSETQLAIQLNYVYNQILSVLTHTQLTQIFEKMPGYDLRYLLQGSEKFVDNILNLTDRDPSFTFGGVRCLAMSVSLRQIITGILMQCRSKDVLYAVVIANNQVVTYIKSKDHNLVPLDIHLIINLVDASTSFKSAESWTPICLPKFNDTGFLHAHVSFLPNDSPACLLLFSVNKEKFFEMQDCQQKIVEKLERQGCIDLIREAVLKESCYNIDHLQAPEIRHFLYKSRKTSCITSPQIPPTYSEQEDEARLYSLYMFMHEVLHSRAWPTKILYHVGNKEALLGWRTAGFDLYIVFDPLISKAQAILLGNKLIKWISKEEDRLIITSAHTF